MATQTVGATKLSKALLDSMDALAKVSIESSKAKTLTLEAEIVEIVDQGRGQYKVKYLDNKFLATSQNESSGYEVGDIVYILVPEGNFDKEIIILSSITSEVSTASTVKGDLFIPIGDSLYGNSISIDLCSFRKENFLLDGDKDLFAKSFIEYLKDNRTFNLSCFIRTNIEANRRSNGNYGLVLTIPVVDINGTSSNYIVTLDINNILGSAYNFTERSLQNLYFTIPDGLSFDENNKSALTLTSFIEDFPTQHHIDPSTGQYIEERIPDVWITNIGVFPTKVVSRVNKEGYYLKLRATEGSLFWGAGSDTKELYPDLYLNGRSTSADPFDCYWFKEDYRIGVGKEGFNSYGGVGWRLINEQTEETDTESGQKVFKPNLEQRKKRITIKEVHTDLRYKCVLVKDSVILTDIITIRNIKDPADFILTTDTEKTKFTKGIGDAILVIKYHDSDLSDDAAMQYEFKRFNQYSELLNDSDPDIFKLVSETANETVVDENGKDWIITKFSLPVKEIINSNTIYCTAYKSQIAEDGTAINDEIIATASITLSTEESPSFKIVLENADKVFKYDVYGNSPLIGNYDGPESSKIKVITPILARAYKEDGSEFNEDEYNISEITWKIPKNSLIVIKDEDLKNAMVLDPNNEYYILKGNYIDYKNLTYSIANFYSKDQSDNTLRVNIKMQNLSIDGIATIKFLKDGESGTNGSKFAAIIGHGKDNRPYEEIELINTTEGSVERMHKLQLIYIDPPGEEPEWYLYNSATDEYILYTGDDFNSNSDNIDKWTGFHVTMYCDGERMVESGINFEPEWEIFDFPNKYSKVVSPIRMSNNILYIRHEEDDETKGLIKWPSDPNQPKVFAATIVVSCLEMKSSEDSASAKERKMFAKRVRAYYPIEITYSKTRAIINQKLIPSLNGGFTQALYSSDGNRPQYNSNSNFVFNDRLEKDASDLNGQSYFWSSSESLVISDVEDDEGIVKPLEKKITPKAERFPDNNGCQYVRVDFGYDVNPLIIQPQLDELTIEQTSLSNNKLYLENIADAASIIIEYQGLREEIVNEITSRDNLLYRKQDLCKFLDNAIFKIADISEVYEDILSSDGQRYLNMLFGNQIDVYCTRLLDLGARKIGEDNFSNIRTIFTTYGTLENCHYDVVLGSPKGVYINASLFEPESTYYKTGASSKKIAKCREAINSFNTWINNKYENEYYPEITSNNSEFQEASILYERVRNLLQGFLQDKKNGSTGKYDGENGVYTYTDKISLELVSRWDILKEEYRIIDEEELDNPYYNIFNPIYENINIIINNMKENKFKSYEDIINVLNSIHNQLYLYYTFSISSKINEINTELTEKTEEIDGLNQLLDNYGVSSLIHIKPIIMLFTPTATWLDWDGNSIKIDENNAVISAPMFAAGTYDSPNGLFTGLTMGVQREEVDEKIKQRIGLLGHYDGQQSLFIDAETGRAEFGLEKSGQIIIDPSTESLKIYDSYYKDKTGTSGMCISFGDRQEGTSQPTAGYIHFKNADGKIYSGDHTNKSSNNAGFYLSHDGFSIGSGVHIDVNGNFTFGIQGTNKTITWDGGDFVIGEGISLTASNIKAGVGITCGPTSIDSSGNLRVTNKFTVSNTGHVYIGGDATIEGTITCATDSQIGNWKVNSDGSLYGYVNKTDSDQGLSTIRLLTSKGVIGFTSGKTIGSGGNDYAYIGGACKTDDNRNRSTKKNFLCIYPNITGDLDHYGSLRLRNLICESGSFLGHTNEWGAAGIFFGCHNNQGQILNPGNFEVEGVANKNKAIKIDTSGIYKWNGSKWVLVLDF